MNKTLCLAFIVVIYLSNTNFSFGQVYGRLGYARGLILLSNKFEGNSDDVFLELEKKMGMDISFLVGISYKYQNIKFKSLKNSDFIVYKRDYLDDIKATNPSDYQTNNFHYLHIPIGVKYYVSPIFFVQYNFGINYLLNNPKIAEVNLGSETFRKVVLDNSIRIGLTAFGKAQVYLEYNYNFSTLLNDKVYNYEFMNYYNDRLQTISVGLSYYFNVLRKKKI